MRIIYLFTGKVIRDYEFFKVITIKTINQDFAELLYRWHESGNMITLKLLIHHVRDTSS
jgi:hypothetical protein